MIDNAIRAERGFTEKDSDKKIINVDAVSDSVSVYITVRNYVSGVEISREDDSSLHGYGQQILGDIAQIYSEGLKSRKRTANIPYARYADEGTSDRGFCLIIRKSFLGDKNGFDKYGKYFCVGYADCLFHARDYYRVVIFAVF